MSPLQIIRLVFIILKIITGIICIIYLCMLIKFMKNKSKKDEPVSITEQSQLKVFSLSLIIFFITSCIELILRFIAAFV